MIEEGHLSGCLGFEFKVIVTNKSLSPKKLLQFHNGRGTQKGILGELKSQM